MKREEFQTVYDSGFEASFALVESLSQSINALTARVQQLEDRLAKNSQNSSKPPSSEQPVKPNPKSLRRISGKKPGRQEGHPGRTLSLVEDPHHIVIHGPKACQGCGQSLLEAVASGYERRQVVDIPALLALEVTEHQAQRKSCSGCGRSTTASFPTEVSARVGYGPRIKALGVYLMNYQLLPYERTSELLEDLFGEPAPGAGTLHSVLGSCFEGLHDTEEAIKAGIRQAPVGHFDETGLRVGEKGMWVHVASTTKLTHYAVHQKRGSLATKEIGILPSFRGVAVHDGLTAYANYEQCKHALCNAHHLRELTFIEEEHEQQWAGQMKALLMEIEEAVREEAARRGKRLVPETTREFHRRYQRLLTKQGLQRILHPSERVREGGPNRVRARIWWTG